MEDQRLQAVLDLELLDTEPEAELDELVRLAASICAAPISTISILDERRQWFKAKVGLEETETPREIAFCDYTIRGEDLLVVEDAALDDRFSRNPLVTGKTGVRFYAGMPVSGRDGLKIGTLCVIDRRPRQLSKEQRETLKVLARQVTARMELRLQRLASKRLLEEKSRLFNELKASDDLFRTFMDHSPLASFVKDQEGALVFCNRRMAESTGIAAATCVGRKDCELWPETVANSLNESDKRALLTGQVIEVDETTVHNGRTTEWHSFKFPWRNAAGEQMVAGISIDVTAERQRDADLRHYQLQLEEANARLLQISLTDPLTGLANRRALNERMKALAVSPSNPPEELALLMIDVDHFKKINDSFGHAYGDLVLERLAAIITQTTRLLDLAARFGGEEFAVLLPQSGVSGAVALATRVQAELRSYPWEHHPVTVSMGISVLSPQESSLVSALARSDRALYAAKRAGRDCIRVVRHALSPAVPPESEEYERSEPSEAEWSNTPPNTAPAPYPLRIAV